MDRPRTVTLVLCRRDGTVLGSLAPFAVPVPWWQEVRPVVERAREVAGIDVTVLRLLHADSPAGAGGQVTYLAEVAAPVSGLAPWPEPLPDHPRRLSYARPGGPAADLEWADATLGDLGRPLTSAPRQVRSWNLSSLWRLPTARGAVWLKVVPPFFAHEGAVIAALDPAVVPPLLAHDGPRVLLDEIAGRDLYGATGHMLLRMVTVLVGLQAQWVGRCAELRAFGLPDWRGEPFASLAAAALDRTADQLAPATVRTCAALVASLPERFVAIAACGVPDTLVHGDFHTGNLMGDETSLTLLDWGDCGVGNPLLDRAAFLPGVPPNERSDVRAHWDDAWRAAVPGSDPARADELVRPVAALLRAVVYDGFVQAIEPSERVYHASDAARWLRTLD